jgi:uncharacterized protein
MRYLNRHAEHKLKRYAQTFKVVLVTGARQVGKSTLLRHVFPDVKNAVFDPVQDLYNARNDPDQFLRTFGTPLLLDEVQYAPEILPAIKRRVDQNDAKGQYVLTGSQNLSVLRNVSESLAGRVGILRLDGLTPAERFGQSDSSSWLLDYLAQPEEFIASLQDVKLIHTTDSLTGYLWKGELPGLAELDTQDTPAYLSSYVQTYVERDIRIMGNISDLSQFGYFLRLCGALTGQEIFQSQLGRELGISPKTARHWLDLLVHSYQWLEVPAYAGNAIKKLSAKPKGHLQDSGLACYLNGITSPKSLLSSPRFGSVFESWGVGWIHKQIQRLPLPPRLHHWRTNNGAEVDLVLELDGHLYPIEFKAATNLTKHDTRSIRAFCQTYANAKPGIILYGGDEAYALSEVAAAIPWRAA